MIELKMGLGDIIEMVIAGLLVKQIGDAPAKMIILYSVLFLIFYKTFMPKAVPGLAEGNVAGGSNRNTYADKCRCE